MRDEQELSEPLQGGFASHHRHSISQESLIYLRELQGECKIKEYCYLKMNYAKIFLLLVPASLTIIGFLLAYHYRNVRVALAFRRLPPKDFLKATHIYVKSNSGIDSICQIYSESTSKRIFTLFRFEELIYEVTEGGWIPLGLHIKEEAEHWLRGQWTQGLKQEEVEQGQRLFGRNEHLVKIPSYHEYLFNALTNFKISILYVNVTITLIEYSLLYGLLLIGLSLLTININYILTWKFYSRIKDIAEKDYIVTVVREGRKLQLHRSLLVPGDIYQLEGEVPCDSIVLKGSAFVNEVGFTGENIPVGKFALEQLDRVSSHEHWLYEGSPLVTCREGTLAVAVSGGFSTRKGKIIRKILHVNPSTSEFFRCMLPFIAEVVIVHILLFAIFFEYMFKDINNWTIIWLRFGEFMVSSIPGFLQVEENLFKSIYLLRLNKQGVIGTDCQKTIESSRLKTVCFDKTGTLTQNEVEIQGVIIPHQTTLTFHKHPTEYIMSQRILRALFATCHAVQKLKDGFHGDEVDLKMYAAAKVLLKDQEIAQGVVFEATSEEEGGKNLHLEVLRVHQFQSRFQSMSVIVRDKITAQTYVFAKGAPEKLHVVSTVRFPKFTDTIRQLSLEGFRSIAVSFKKIDNVQEALLCDREACLNGTALIGIVTFANALKADAAETIATLSTADINVKMITGDNIFVAIQTALSLEIVPNGQRIIALQGSRLKNVGELNFVAVRREGAKITQQEIKVKEIGLNSFQGEYLAMDFDFLKQNEQFFHVRGATIFARATPEIKAVILKKEKEKLAAEYAARSWKSRTFGGRIRKVAMVGDGANDLMAIREADVGIGISNSDAVYGADFTVTDLTQAITIIRQSRSGEQKMLQLIQYYYIYRFMDMTCKILQTQDYSLYPSNTGIIRNFLTEYALCVILAFGKASPTLSKYFPCFNMLSLQNQLIYWGSSLIVGIGISADYYYYRSTPDFVPNPNSSKLNWNTKTGTITLLINIVLSITINISVVQSFPWKKRIWTNVPSIVILILNAIFITTILFNTKHLHAMGLNYIDEIEALKMYFIAIGVGTLCFFYNVFIHSKHMYRTQE